MFLFGSETVSKQSTKIGLVGKYVCVWQLKSRSYHVTMNAATCSKLGVSSAVYTNQCYFSRDFQLHFQLNYIFSFSFSFSYFISVTIYYSYSYFQYL